MPEKIGWAAGVREQFQAVLAKMPVFLRGIAEQKISQKAEAMALEAGRPEIVEKDLVDALFAETPFGFQGLMKNDLKDLGIDYTQYGHAR